MNWRPSSGPGVAWRRAAMLDRARRYFTDRGILAVDTPALGPSPASDPGIESFAVETGRGGEYFLHTSPESCMKRLLAAGYPDIYSICRVFRAGESGARNAAEFTLIEWYRRGFDLQAMIADTAGLIAHVLESARLGEQVEQLDYAEAFMRYAEVDVFAATRDQLGDRAGAETLSPRSGEWQRDELLDLILVTSVAPRFAEDRLTVLRHYPVSQAALARICPDDSRVADRFEVFLGETELANGYVELTDAAEQRRRFDAERERRRVAGSRHAAADEPLLAALAAGLPQCAGVAVGFERLQMIAERAGHIREVVTFLTDS